MRPIMDRVVVRPDTTVEERVSGIIVPDVARETPTQGEVLAVHENEWIGVGDRVLYGKYAGTFTRIDGDEVAILKLADILVVL